MFIIFILAPPLSSQEENDSLNTRISEYEPPDRFGLWLGYFGPSFEASVRVNSRTLGLGSYVSLENAFELPTSQNVFKIESAGEGCFKGKLAFCQADGAGQSVDIICDLHGRQVCRLVSRACSLAVTDQEIGI